MAYSASYKLHLAKTQSRKVFKTGLEAKFRFGDEIAIESEADPDFKSQVNQRIGDYDPKVNNLFGYLNRQGWKYEGAGKFENDGKTMSHYICGFKTGFDIKIEAVGRIEQKDLIDLEAINDYILKGDAESEGLFKELVSDEDIALDGSGDDIKLSENPPKNPE